MCREILISVLILYLGTDYSHQYKVLNITQKADNHWDYLIFTQLWPPTQCKIWSYNKPNHHCVYPHQSNVWTVHGLWPTKIGTIGPENCNKTWLFDPEKVKPIEDELEQAWTNIEKETPLYGLWEHEWDKHGTCAAVLPPLNNEYNYFSKGIEFHKQHDMAKILSAANIEPSDTNELTLQDLSDAVESKLGFKPYIKCSTKDGVQYLHELRICFDKQLNLRKCDGIVGFELYQDFLTDCHPSKKIIYPTQSPPQRVSVELYKFVKWLQWLTL